MTSTYLESRVGLPDALRVLLEDYPRDAWDSDTNFSQLVRFWLDRHLMFRRLAEVLTESTEKALDAKMGPARFASQLSRYGATFVGELHGHHTIEDTHYFPQLKLLDSRLERGFEILDSDHHALDAHLAGFSDAANAALRGINAGQDALDEIAVLRERLLQFETFLNRHLIDEEELVVPVLLKHAPPGMV